MSLVWNFCNHFSDVFCGETGGGIAKYQLFSQGSVTMKINKIRKTIKI